MEIKENYSFQVDSGIVKEVYQNQDNYLIEYSKDIPKNYCVIYFSSNDIYYPNTEIAFQEQLLGKNRFEWYKTRVNIGYKHIFIRDIQKQWYLGGINLQIDTPQKLITFLRDETAGYQIIVVGSSAGGFAAVIYGQLLNAEKIYSFNGQFEIRSILSDSSEEINPLIFRHQENKMLEKWYDTRNFITSPSTIFYFQSCKSRWDIEQFEYVKDIPINRIKFNTRNHGVPFLSTNLPSVINRSSTDLLKLTSGKIHPIVFSFRSVGLYQTIIALAAIIKFGLKKIYIHTILKFK
jgi:hypothetical protein